MKKGDFRPISFVLLVIGLFLLTGLFVGCDQDKPEVSREEYGKIVTELPKIKDRPQSFKLPDGVENSEECLIEKRIMREKETFKK